MDAKSGPGPKQSVEFLSFMGQQNNKDSDASSGGGDIPANIGKRKRRDVEPSCEPSTPPYGPNGNACNSSGSARLKRPRRSARLATTSSISGSAVRHIYAIPGSPGTPRRSTRLSKRQVKPDARKESPPVGSELDGKESDGEENVHESTEVEVKENGTREIVEVHGEVPGFGPAKYGQQLIPGRRKKILFPGQMIIGGKVFQGPSPKLSGDSFETYRKEKAKFDNDVVEALREQARLTEQANLTRQANPPEPEKTQSLSGEMNKGPDSMEEVAFSEKNKGRPLTRGMKNRPDLVEKAASPGVLGRPVSSGLKNKLHRVEDVTLPEPARGRRSIRGKKTKLDRVEVVQSFPPSTSLPVNERQVESAGGSQDSSYAEESSDEHAHSPDYQSAISAFQGSRSDNEMDTDHEYFSDKSENSGPKKGNGSWGDESDHSIQTDEEGDPNYESEHRVRADSDIPEGGSVWDDIEVDFSIARVFLLQRDNWNALALEADKLRARASGKAKSPFLLGLLKRIRQAKKLYVATKDMRHDKRAVPDKMVQAEQSSAQDIVTHLDRALDAIRLVFDQKGNLITARHELDVRRQAVDEIIVHVVPQIVELLKVCLASHYAEYFESKISVTGLNQITRLLESLHVLCKKIQPKFFRPFIYLTDVLKSVRLSSGFIWTVFAEELERLLATERRERFNNSLQQRKASLHQQSEQRDRLSKEVTPAITDEEHDKAISITSGSSHVTDESCEIPDELDWTTEQSEALVAGLQKHQGPKRYVHILCDYMDELSGRTREDLRVKAREIRDSYVAAMKLENRVLDAREWRWLLEV
ncbi:hypothetical protein AJ79_08604 [Helicocarpus griseus UAMH5409]|uniref:Uncharacterized protein n=1 Tax=Helicocarpus griseus UAMH5409 TaxID=1447875 RepID=A0A2B7WRZ6_9EURO|nr:hypothetical protein AJ79_08604 [Helicocarpus griseus UAMH5409]